MTIIKKEDWQNSGRFVRNCPDENPVPKQPTNAIQAAASDSADDPLAPSQAYVLDAQNAASREADGGKKIEHWCKLGCTGIADTRPRHI